MKLISESNKPKGLMELEVHENGYKPVDSLEWRSINSAKESTIIEPSRGSGFLSQDSFA